MTTNEEKDKRPESFRCSGLVRRAAAILATSHQGRVWPVNESPFAKVPLMMGINLAQVVPEKEILAATMLHGLGDEPSPCPDRMQVDFCQSNVGRIHDKASWTRFARDIDVRTIGDWPDVMVRWRGHLERTSPAALLVICAYEHYLLTALDDMFEQTEDPSVWKRWYLGFPAPYNQFGMPDNPYLMILEHYRGKYSPKPTERWVGVLGILNQRLKVGVKLLNEMKMIIRGLDTTFRTAELI
jgi:hypothetical protein